MRQRLSIGVLCLAFCLLPASWSSAHTFSAGTSLSSRDVPSGAVDKGDRVLVFGKLKSAQATCRAGETVELRRKSRTLGTDVTDAEGEYRFRIRVRKDMRVFVQFDGSVETSYGHSHTCRGSNSKSVFINVEAPTRRCTPGYSPCLPPASDYDCAGGSGDGPKYVQGPVKVTGSDPYGLDSDNDGVGCE